MGSEHVLPVTKLVNWLLAKPALVLLAFLHIRPENSAYPVPNYLAMELVVFLFAIVFCLWLKPRLSADRPGATQQTVEFLITNPMGVGVKDLVDDIVGHGAERHLALMGTIGIFILLSNLAALFPGFMSPTAEKTVPLGCAVVVFLYYNWIGISKHGPGRYAKTLMGPVRWLSWLIASHRNDQPFCAAAFPHRSSLGQYVGRRDSIRHFPWAVHHPVRFPRSLEPRWIYFSHRPGGNPVCADCFSYF